MSHGDNTVLPTPESFKDAIKSEASYIILQRSHPPQQPSVSRTNPSCLKEMSSADLQEKEEKYMAARAKLFTGPDLSEVPTDSYNAPMWTLDPEEESLYDRNAQITSWPLKLESLQRQASPQPTRFTSVDQSRLLIVHELKPGLKKYQVDLLLDEVKAIGGVLHWRLNDVVVEFPTADLASKALAMPCEKFKLLPFYGLL